MIWKFFKPLYIEWEIADDMRAKFLKEEIL